MDRSGGRRRALQCELLADLSLLRSQQYVAYGPYRNWYNWLPPEMSPACWGFGPPRILRIRAEAAAYNGSTPFSHDCTRPGIVGPFPMAAGPLLALSAPLVRVLTPLMRADTAYVLGEWLHTPLRNNFDGKVYPPDSPSHPAANVLSQDTYLFYLIYPALPNASVVHVRPRLHGGRQQPLLGQTRRIVLADWHRHLKPSTRMRKPHGPRELLDRVVYGPHKKGCCWARGVHASTPVLRVYHHLKSAKHFKRFTQSRWERMLKNNRTRLFCGARDDRLVGQAVHNDSLGHMMERHFGCCRRWEMCMMVPPGPWRGRRPPRKGWFWFLDPRGGRLYWHPP